jgi:hypothetical protein
MIDVKHADGPKLARLRRLTRLEYMLTAMRDPSVDADRRDRMAAAAASFLHPRLQAVEARVDVRHNVRELSAAEMLEVLSVIDDAAEELPQIPGPDNSSGDGI